MLKWDQPAGMLPVPETPQSDAMVDEEGCSSAGDEAPLTIHPAGPAGAMDGLQGHLDEEQSVHSQADPIAQGFQRPAAHPDPELRNPPPNNAAGGLVEMACHGRSSSIPLDRPALAQKKRLQVIQEVGPWRSRQATLGLPASRMPEWQVLPKPHCSFCAQFFPW